MSDPYETMRTGYVRDHLSAEEVAEEAALVAPVSAALRDLIEALIRSEVGAEELALARADIERATARLSVRQIPGSYGVRLGDTHARSWGNPAVGLRNAMAPPLLVERQPDRSVVAEVDLGARFEGPPGLVHGGISALLLDQLVGEAAAAAGTPGMTGRLTLHYRRPTPLGRLRLEAEVAGGDGVKSTVQGRLLAPTPDGWQLCVEAEAVMILPRWARAQIEATGVGNVGGDALADPPPAR